MAIKSQRDFFSGLMFLVVGAVFAFGATQYKIGSSARMGPGYFPLLLGILLAALGVAIVFYSLIHDPLNGKDGDKIDRWAWKPIFYVLGANVLFGICLGGLPSIGFPSLGLVVGIFLLVATGALADKSNQPKAMFQGFLLAIPITALGLSLTKAFPHLPNAIGATPFLIVCLLMTALILCGFLAFLLPLIFSRLANQPAFYRVMVGLAFVIVLYGLYLISDSNDQASLVSKVSFIAEMEFKIIVALAFVNLIPKAFKKIGIQDSNPIQLGLLISVMSFLSVWAFIDGLRLQIPMWPTFMMS